MPRRSVCPQARENTWRVWRKVIGKLEKTVKRFFPKVLQLVNFSRMGRTSCGSIKRIAGENLSSCKEGHYAGI